MEPVRQRERQACARNGIVIDLSLFCNKKRGDVSGRKRFTPPVCGSALLTVGLTILGGGLARSAVRCILADRRTMWDSIRRIAAK
jgi:hypothetical protein